MVLNFRWLRRIVTGALGQAGVRGEAGSPGARLAVEFVVKFGALVAVVYVLVSRTGVDIVALLVGLSTVFIAVVVESLRRPASR
jgi:hypothetical protein